MGRDALEKALLNAMGDSIVDREYVQQALSVVYPIIEELEEKIESLYEDMAGADI
jgi:hypothetical protein